MSFLLPFFFVRPVQTILLFITCYIVFMQQQLAHEAKLANQQVETLKANYKKFRLIDGLNEDGAVKRLAEFYKMPVSDP